MSLTMEKPNPIPTYIINLEKRADRRISILNAFTGKTEFTPLLVAAEEHTIGAVGLWNSLVNIVKEAAEKELEYIIVCEDDHLFTEAYSAALLMGCIEAARCKHAEILIGGASWLDNVIRVTDHLYWVENFTGLQFAVYFKSLYQKILNASFLPSEAADAKISRLTENKMVIYPFISVQHDFGYSDVTTSNEIPGRLKQLFDSSAEKISLVNKVTDHFRNLTNQQEMLDPDEYDSIRIPAYIINLPERKDRLEHILREFEHKNEFDVTVVPACKHPIGAVGLWLSIRKVVGMAMQNDDDVILVCEDDHLFTDAYSKNSLIKNILEAHQQGADLLCGGIGHFTQMIPLSENRFWVDTFWSTQFLLLFRRCFDKILSEPFDEKVTADDFLSELVSNKMVMFPFISVQKPFGYSDVNENRRVGDLHEFFERASARIGKNLERRKLYANG